MAFISLFNYLGEEMQKWFFSIVDVCGVLTEQPDYDHAKNYWKVLKHRLIKEGNESVTNCNQLKLVSPKDGKCCWRRMIKVIGYWLWVIEGTRNDTGR